MDSMIGGEDFTSGILNDDVEEKLVPDIPKDGAKHDDKDDDKEKLIESDDVQAKKCLGMAMAKPCIAKAIDYTMLEALLLIQYSRCQPPNLEEIVKDAAMNPEQPIDQSSFYSCGSSESADQQLLFSENAIINAFVIAAISVGIFYGIFCGIIVWFHSRRKAKDVEIHPLTEKLYKCTEKILIIDSLLEIPISFFWAPYMTIFLWSSYLIAILGLFLLSTSYNKIAEGDENAQAVFLSSATLTGLSLLKLTGEIAQYWVLYTASISSDSRSKYAARLMTDE